MKAYVFSIGEKTTDLCCELMSEYGFDVVLLKDNSTLWDKMKLFYTTALETGDNFFVRIDADIIPLPAIKNLKYKKNSWFCASGFDWYKMDIGAISIHTMSRNVIEKCLSHIDEAENEIRPESYLWRLNDINSSTLIDDRYVYGIHGYGQKTERDRIKKLKLDRHQTYDWELVDRIESI